MKYTVKRPHGSYRTFYYIIQNIIEENYEGKKYYLSSKTGKYCKDRKTALHFKKMDIAYFHAKKYKLRKNALVNIIKCVVLKRNTYYTL
jgi:hypothetical protein